MGMIYQRRRDFTICGVGFCPTTRAEFVKEVFSMPIAPVSGTITLIGVPGVNSAMEDPRVAEIYAASSFAAIDGMPVVKIAKKKGFNCERCAAPDIMPLVFEESVKQGKTHYFYGGKDTGVLEKLKTNLERNYPGIQIVGMYSPPFRSLTEEEDKKICDIINNLHPDLLWVGIGAPKQEIWMWNHREKIKKTVMLGVGAGFDFLAGTLDKAPEWVEKASLEWLYRLGKEPKRLWKRYVFGGIKWMYYRGNSRIKGLDK